MKAKILGMHISSEYYIAFCLQISIVDRDSILYVFLYMTFKHFDL